jgi:DNA-binding NarL/FixJ family response regulator
LIEAEMWAWIHFKDDPEVGPPVGFAFIDGGWQSEFQRMKFVEGTISPAAEPLNIALRKDCDAHQTRRREDLLANNEWFSSDLARNYFEPAGVGEYLSSLYPLGNSVFSSMVFLRRLGSPPFSPREVCIAHVVTEEIDWLHREGTDVPAAAHVTELSTRQRQVMFQLLAGDSVKQIARKLSLSNYTVNDHIKQIYRRFGVSGRGELLAQFLSGGQPGRK